MIRYHYIIRLSDSGKQPVLAEGDVEASRFAVAVKKAAEAVKDTQPKGKWVHVSLQRRS